MCQLNKKVGKYKKYILWKETDREFNMLVKDLWLHDELFFLKYFRMSTTILEECLSWIAPYIQKGETKMRKTISAREVQVSVLHWDIWSLTMPCYNSTELSFESSNWRKNNKWDLWSNTRWTYWQRLPGSSKVWAWLAESSLRIWGQLEFSYSATLRHFFQDFIPINFQVIFSDLKTSFAPCLVRNFYT